MATAPKAATKSLKAVPSPDAREAPASSKKLILIIVGAVLFLAVGIGGAWFVLGARHNEGGAVSHVENKTPVFLTMETFTVNLQVEEVPQFLQVGMTLQVANEATAELIKQNMPQVRNRLLLLLSSKKSSELLSVDGKKKLATEIIDQIRQPFSAQGSKPEVSDVFFTSFVIQ